MRKLKIVLATLVALALAMPALAADFKFSGDLNHRFNLFTNQADMYSGTEGIAKNLENPKATEKGTIDEDDIDEFFGEIKYRLVTEASTNDGKVKGVYAIELGALKFGRAGGGYSGDGVNIETRWAYTDVELPTAAKTRLLIGLQPFTVNKYVWSETAMGVQLKGEAGPVDYTLAWMRGNEYFNTSEDDDLFEDADGFLLRGDIKPAEGVKLGLFALYERARAADNASTADVAATTTTGSFTGSATGDFDENAATADTTTDVTASGTFTTPAVAAKYVPTYDHELKRVKNVDYDLYTLGVDGGLTAGNLFANWDLMYQTGDAQDGDGGDFDMQGYFVHADLGVNLGASKLTYTGWYASGDDDDNDNDVDNFIATDVDTFDSVIFFEGGYTDDNYFTEAPYILNKGMIFNKLAVDHQATDKVKVGAALLYLMTAEDLTLADNSKEDKLGTEIDAYVSYQLYPNVLVALNAGYLFADDAMDFWEVPAQQDGKADADVYRTTMQVRYTF